MAAGVGKADCTARFVALHNGFYKHIFKFVIWYKCSLQYGYKCSLQYGYNNLQGYCGIHTSSAQHSLTLAATSFPSGDVMPWSRTTPLAAQDAEAVKELPHSLEPLSAADAAKCISTDYVHMSPICLLTDSEKNDPAPAQAHKQQPDLVNVNYVDFSPVCKPVAVKPESSNPCLALNKQQVDLDNIQVVELRRKPRNLIARLFSCCCGAPYDELPALQVPVRKLLPAEKLERWEKRKDRLGKYVEAGAADKVEKMHRRLSKSYAKETPETVEEAVEPLEQQADEAFKAATLKYVTKALRAAHLVKSIQEAGLMPRPKP